MNYPVDLKYSKSHEWIRYEDGVAVIGISILPRTCWVMWSL